MLPPESAPGKSVTERAFAVLMSFDINHRRMTLSQISRRTGLPVATTFRLLDRLEAITAVERSSDGLYSIGPKIWELGILAPTHDVIGMGTRPLLRSLAAHSGGVVRVFVHNNQNALCVEEVLAHGGSTAAGGPGLTLPLHACAAGQAILTSIAPSVRNALPITRMQLTDLEAALGIAHRRGWVRMVRSDGTVEYAVPLHAADRPPMSLSVDIHPSAGSTRPQVGTEALVRELQSVARTLAGILDTASDSRHSKPESEQALSRTNSEHR
ncbi:IclR family transcriptional regulator [Rhodococcus sp. IEGM 1330]|uniref:IclR family transcriptional regulator n=1 Tax=Rhodococcus sp. IEGM 1330 TaxID=3082225 RepID=UPI002954BD00|nr:helix-turn-helix domain-containing protein [Rhodococcus sp. IEGM 1330]MDV8022719.1 helix-turn-helix domain-containing protein [Rhodococcus sp. IEGM 1330]